MNPSKNHAFNGAVLKVGPTVIILAHVSSYREDQSSVILTLPHGQITLHTKDETSEIIQGLNLHFASISPL